MNKHSIVTILLLFCAIILAACGNSSQMSINQASTNQVQTAEVQITLLDFHITSSIMTFTPGVRYHFVVTNLGKTAHEFMLLSSMMKTMNMTGMSMNTMDMMSLAHLEPMNPGESKALDYTFALQTAGPHPEFSCHLPGHYEAGMHLDVTVE